MPQNWQAFRHGIGNDAVSVQFKQRSPAPGGSHAVRAELVGDDTCIVGDVRVTSYAPALKMCRTLVAAGHHPATRLEVYRGEVLALTIRTIGEGAQLTVQDDRHGTPRFARHRPPAARRGRQGCGQASPVAPDDCP